MDLTLRWLLGAALGRRNWRRFLLTRELVAAATPSRRNRAQGIGHLDPGFDVRAFWALVASMLEAFRSHQHGNRYHPRLAIWAARTVDWQQLWIWTCPQHGRKNSAARKRVLFGTRQNTIKIRCFGRFSAFSRGSSGDWIDQATGEQRAAPVH
jgi:hypothetical protein